jgi:hypothetical protein
MLDPADVARVEGDGERGLDRSPVIGGANVRKDWCVGEKLERSVPKIL